MNYNDRIGDNINGDYTDNEKLTNTDLNNIINQFKLGINANYDDIQKLKDGTIVINNALKLSNATLSKQVVESLQDSDDKIPTSKQAKTYIDNEIAENIPQTQTKTLTIIENGTYTITPDNDKLLSSVSITVNV